jgi:hypothetical protein
MGMFDISGTGSRQKPMYAEDLYAAGQNMFADQMAPGIKRMTGYESPKRKAMAIAGKADLSSMKSIQDTYGQLQQINAEMASAWLKESLTTFNSSTQRMTAENARLAAIGKKGKDRRIVLQGGIQYYADDGSRVLPGAAGKAVTPEKPSDLPQMTEKEEIRIGSLVDEAFDFGMTDFTGKKTEVDKETITDFVFSYSQIKNVGPSEVLKGLINGTISLDAPINKQATSQASSSQVGFMPTPTIPK